MSPFKKIIALSLAVAGTYFALPMGSAHAAKVPFIYNTGEDVFVAGDGSLPAPFDKVPELAGAQAGYKCEIWGVVWAYVSIKNCKPVAFKGDTFWEEPELTAAILKAHPEASMKPGFWKGYGKFPLGFAILGLIGFGLYSKVKGNDDDDDNDGDDKKQGEAKQG